MIESHGAPASPEEIPGDSANTPTNPGVAQPEAGKPADDLAGKSIEELRRWSDALLVASDGASGKFKTELNKDQKRVGQALRKKEAELAASRPKAGPILSQGDVSSSENVGYIPAGTFQAPEAPLDVIPPRPAETIEQRGPDPRQDPDIQSVEKWINDYTEREMKLAGAGEFGDVAKETVAWRGRGKYEQGVRDKAGTQAWVTFARNNPEKAAMYRERHAGIDRAMKLIEQADQNRGSIVKAEEPAPEAGLTPVAPETQTSEQAPGVSEIKTDTEPVVRSDQESVPTVPVEIKTDVESATDVPQPEQVVAEPEKKEEVDIAGEVLAYRRADKPWSEILLEEDVESLRKLLREEAGYTQLAREKLPLTVRAQTTPDSVENDWRFLGIEGNRVILHKKMESGEQTDYVSLAEFFHTNPDIPEEARDALVQATQKDEGISKILEAGVRRKHGLENSQPKEVAATAGDHEPVVIPADPEVQRNLREILDKKRSGGSVRAEDAAIEGEKKETEESSLQEKREKFARLQASQSKWRGAAKKEEVEAAQNEYLDGLAEEMNGKLDAVRAEFAGRDMKNESVRKEYTDRVVAIRTEFRLDEERQMVGLMRSEQDKGLGAKWMKLWRKSSGIRLLATGGTLAAGVVGTLTGQSWVTQASAATRGVVSGAGSGMFLEAALRLSERQWGAAKNRSKEDVDKINSLSELRRLQAVHNLDAIEYGEGKGKTTDKKGKEHGTELGERRRGFILRKRTDRTGVFIRERITELEKQRNEEKINELVGSGKSLEEIQAEIVKNSLDNELEFNRLTRGRMVRNKVVGAVRFGLSAAVGTAAGIGAAESAVHTSQQIAGAVRRAFPGGHDSSGAGDFASMAKDKITTSSAVRGEKPNGSFLSHGDSSADVPVMPDSLHQAAAAARETHSASGMAAESAAQTVDTAIKIKEHGSIWNAVGEFVEKNYANLNEAQRTWLIDSIKDRIVAHPELVGLHDANVVHAGDTIDLGKLGLPIPELAAKATKLSAETMSSIADNLHHAGHAASAVHEAGAAATQTADAGHAVGAAYETAAPMNVGEVPNAGVMDGAMPVVETVAATKEGLDLTATVPPELGTPFVSFSDSWRALAEADRAPLLKSFAKVTLEKAARPGAIERLVDAAGHTSSAAKMGVVKKLNVLVNMLIEKRCDPHTSLKEALNWLREKRA